MSTELTKEQVEVNARNQWEEIKRLLGNKVTEQVLTAIVSESIVISDEGELAAIQSDGVATLQRAFGLLSEATKSAGILSAAMAGMPSVSESEQKGAMSDLIDSVAKANAMLKLTGSKALN